MPPFLRPFTHIRLLKVVEEAFEQSAPIAKDYLAAKGRIVIRIGEGPWQEVDGEVSLVFEHADTCNCSE